MHIRKIDLNLLAIFDTIMAEKSVSQAAERLGLTQSAVSQALKRLRHLVGDELFVRTGRGVTPTPRATEIAAPIREALDKVHRALAETSDFDPRRTDRIFTLTMIPGYEAMVLPRCLSWLATNAPGIGLKVESSAGADLAEDLKQGRLDTAMSFEEYPGPHFRNELLFEDEIVVLARRDHPLVGKKMTRQQYSNLDHVVLQVPMATGTMVTEQLQRIGLKRRVLHEVPTLTSIPDVVAATDLIATLPLRTSRRFIDQLDLQALAPPIPLAPAKIYQVWHARLDGDPAHRWLHRSIRDVCQKL